MRSAPTTPTNNREAAASLKASLKKSKTDSEPIVGQKRKREDGENNNLITVVLAVMFCVCLIFALYMYIHSYR